MNILIQLGKGAYMPCKAHPEDAGFDLFAPQSVEIEPNSVTKIDTGVHVAIPDGYVGLVLGRSSFGVAGMTTHTGVIDSGYTGQISVVLTSKYSDYIYAGNKVAQLVIVPIPAIKLVEGDVTALKTERGCGGFGSTGR